MKSNYLKFNTFVITVEFGGHVLENPGYVKYLGIILDDKSFWQQHKAYVLERCCQRIGLLRKSLDYLPNNVLILYYNAFYVHIFVLPS